MIPKRYLFTGQGTIPPDEDNWRDLHQRLLVPLDDPAHYHLEDQGLIEAVNSALILGMPLLLTGEPGVGKTQLAYRIAYELGCEAIYFPVKSTSEAQDLFYNIDHLRRLHVAQVDKDKPEAVDIRHFLRFQGLGLAILRAMPEQQLAKLGLAGHAWPNQTPLPRQPSVVLIDEIDKAPMDFCNDMLEEIRRLQFFIPELGGEPLALYADPEQASSQERKYRPQVIITSNSDKGLPEAFLRRCIYYHIQPPDKSHLLAIVQKRLGEAGSLPIGLDKAAVNTSLDFFDYLKNHCRLTKPPSTAELLNWLLVMDEKGLVYPNGKAPDERWQASAKSCLIKHKDDFESFDGFFQQWCDQRGLAT